MNEKKIALWEPLRDLVNIRGDFDHLFDSFFGQMPREIDEFWSPVLDVVENNGNIEVRAELPGMKKEDIKVMVRDNILSVSGERKQEKEAKDKTYHRIERSYGKFYRNIQLPAEVEPDKIKAVYKDGVLSITLPKPESMKPKKIDVEVK
jgi:HSP20 family protein